VEQEAEVVISSTVAPRHDVLHVRSKRDEPPLTDWCARGILVKIENGEPHIALVFDKDAGKLFWCLPGGRGKMRMLVTGKKTKDETPRETVAEEVYEECGVDKERLSPDVFYPVSISKEEKEWHRDENDEKTCGFLTIVQHIFARWGDVPLRQTDDIDSDDSQWFSLSAILKDAEEKRETKHYYEIYDVPIPGGRNKQIAIREGESPPPLYTAFLRKKKGRDILCVSHLFMVLSSLQFIGVEFEKYVRGELTDEDDCAFFGEMARGTASGDDFYALADVMEWLSRIVPEEMLARTVGEDAATNCLFHSEREGENRKRKLSVSFLGGAGYFQKPKAEVTATVAVT